MMKSKKLKGIISFAVAFVFATVLGVSVSLASAQPVNIEDYFLIPEDVATKAYLGETVQIARITPSEDDALNFSFGVVDSANALVETNGYNFVPEREGEYKCIYSYELEGKKYEYSYSISASAKVGPVFRNQPSLPNAFVSGSTYVLPQIEAGDYSQGGKAPVDVAVRATLNGQELAVENNAVTPVSDEVGSTVEITYTAVSSGVTQAIVKKIPVVSVYGNDGKVNPAGLFYQTGAQSIQTTAEHLQFTTTDDLELNFANVLGADGVEFLFGFGDNDQAEAITVKMTSLEDPSVAISLTFKKGRQSEGWGTLILNGNTETPKAFNFTKGEGLKVSFDEASRSLLGEADELLFAVEKDLNGGEFNGFSGGLIKLDFFVEGVYGACDVKFFNVNLQVFSNGNEDLVAPRLSVANRSLEMEIGEVVTLENVKAVDVFDPTAAVSLKVTCAGEDVPVTVLENGDMQFTATIAGTYSLAYTTVDRAGNTGTYRRAMYAYDNVKPVLTVDGKISANVRVGATLNLPAASASDNGGADAIISYVTVVRPTGYSRVIASGNSVLEASSYTFETAGRYYVRYVATDAYDNVVIKEFVVNCEG